MICQTVVVDCQQTGAMKIDMNVRKYMCNVKIIDVYSVLETVIVIEQFNAHVFLLH
jgi:hypothetical protein